MHERAALQKLIVMSQHLNILCPIFKDFRVMTLIVTFKFQITYLFGSILVKSYISVIQIGKANICQAV